MDNIFDKIQKIHRTFKRCKGFEKIMYMIIKGLLTNTFEFKNDTTGLTQYFKNFQLLNFYTVTYRPNNLFYKYHRRYENTTLKKLALDVYKIKGLIAKKILLLKLLELKKRNVQNKILKYIKIIHHKNYGKLHKSSIVNKVYDQLIKFQNFTCDYKDSLKIQVERTQLPGEQITDINHDDILNPFLRPFYNNIVVIHKTPIVTP